MPRAASPDRAAFWNALDEGLSASPWTELAPWMTSEAKDRLSLFYERLVAANAHLNLTAITDPVEFAIKHVMDSLAALLIGEWPEHASVCDVGTGAGIPGLILASVRADLRVTLVDSVAKKLAFAADSAKAMGIEAEIVHARAEELGRNPAHRERFDMVTARAVARLPVLAEYALPLVRVGGWFVALKGPKGSDESAEARRAIEVLGGESPILRSVALPQSAGDRTLIAIKKRRPAPRAYPRKPGIPAKRPLARG